VRVRCTAFMLIAAVFLLPTYAFSASSNDQQRLCTYPDLIDKTWKAVQLTETPARREAAWYRQIPYHYLTFYSNRQYSSVATNMELPTPDAVQKAFLWPTQGKHVLQYTLSKQGVLNLYVDKDITYSYRCVVVTEPHSYFVKDDLILTAYTKNAKTQLYKLYRRWF